MTGESESSHCSSAGVYWYDPVRGKAWPFDGHHPGDGKLIKLVDQSVMPPEFVCFWEESTRPIKFCRTPDGFYDQWIWNGEWVWDDSVGADTALDYFSDPATLVASFLVR